MLYSADSILTSELSREDNPMLNYPIEHLSEINCSGMPLAKLEIKIGCPIVVLKNLDAAHGCCNGSREILTRCSNRVLEVELITGSHVGQKVFIPRTNNMPTEDQIAFKFNRRQFPIRVCFAMCYR